MKATDRISDEMLEALIDIEKVFIGKYEDWYKEPCDIDIAIVTALEELQSYRFTEITPEQIIEMDKEYRKKMRGGGRAEETFDRAERNAYRITDKQQYHQKSDASSSRGE